MTEPTRMTASHPSTNKVSIEISVSTDKVGSKCTRKITWDREDWESMTDRDRDEAMFEELLGRGLLQWGWRMIE